MPDVDPTSAARTLLGGDVALISLNYTSSDHAMVFYRCEVISNGLDH